MWLRAFSAARATLCGPANTASASTIHIAFALNGATTPTPSRRRTITELGDRVMPRRLRRQPVHPGEILREQFMPEFGLSVNRIARDLRVPVTRIAGIVHVRRAVTSDTALRLGRYFGTSLEFWMNLQTAYDLDVRPIAAA